MVIHTQNDATEQFIDDLRKAVHAAAEGELRPLMQLVLKIQDKDGNMVPFILKPAQEFVWNNRSPADINVKAAQMGISTMEIAGMFTEAMVIPGLECIIVAQREESVLELFQIVDTFISAMPEAMRPALIKETEHIIIFDHSKVQPGLTSRITTGTINSNSVGRGRPRHRALFTEVAFYPPEAQKIMAGIIARMPYGKSRVILESTADGQSGYFFELWTAATDGEKDELTRTAYKPHFIPWFMAPEYRIPHNPADTWGRAITEYADDERYLKITHGLNDDQIRWRRYQEALIGKDMRKQEFPETSDEAFLPVGSAVFETHIIDRHTHGIKDAGVILAGYEVWCQPEYGGQYIVALDQASGEQRDPNNRPLDFNCITVWNAVTLEQCARYRKRGVNPRELAKLAVEISMLYNEALIVPESNLAKFGFMDWLIEFGANAIYLHTNPNTSSLSMGYPMNVATKPALKDNFKGVLAVEGGCYIHSANLIKEIRNFRFLKGSGMRAMGAAVGGNDDELITAFLAFDPKVREQAISLQMTGRGKQRMRTRSSKAF